MINGMELNCKWEKDFYTLETSFLLAGALMVNAIGAGKS